MPEDQKPEKNTPERRTPGKGAGGRQATPAGKGLGGSSAAGRGAGKGPGGKASGKGSGKGGRTRPQQAAVAKPKPWGLIAAAVAVVVFAGAVIGYAVYAVDKSKEDDVTAADQIQGVQAFDYAAGQEHVTTNVSYSENPPVGGPHDPYWADCTGTVYDIDIRHENAVHSLEHGAVWITYDPDVVSGEDVQKLADLVEGNSGLMLSPYAGLATASDLGTPVSLQSWNHRLGVDSVDDPRIQQYIDFFTYGSEADGTSLYPEVGASCQNPDFAANPLPAEASSEPIGESDAPTTDSAAPATGSADPSTDPAATTTN